MANYTSNNQEHAQLGFYRETCIRSIVLVIWERPRGHLIERKLRILSSAARRDGMHLPVGREFIGAWPPNSIYNQCAFFETINARNVGDAIDEVDARGRYHWTN